MCVKLGDRRADQRRLAIRPSVAIGSPSSSSVCGGKLGSTGDQVNHQLPEQIERDRADILQLALARPGPCAASTACVASTNWFARSASAMISRMARL